MDTYVEEREVGSDTHGYMSVIGLWGTCRICAFNIYVVDTYAESYILCQHEGRKKGKYLDFCL